MTHTEPHLLAGRMVHLDAAVQSGGNQILPSGYPLTVDDWWDRMNGKSWRENPGNPAAMMYGIRAELSGLPLDDEVIYGHVNGLGYLVHVSEIGEIIPEKE